MEKVADGYGYDLAGLPRKKSCCPRPSRARELHADFGEMVKDREAMKRFGQTMVLWDFHARKPKKVLHVPGVAARDPLGLGAEQQLRFHLDRAHVEDLARLRGRGRRVAG